MEIESWCDNNGARQRRLGIRGKNRPAHTFFAVPRLDGAVVFLVVEALTLPASTFLGAAVVFLVAVALGLAAEVGLAAAGFLVVAVLVAAALDGGFEFYDIWSTMGTSTIK